MTARSAWYSASEGAPATTSAGSSDLAALVHRATVIFGPIALGATAGISLHLPTQDAPLLALGHDKTMLGHVVGADVTVPAAAIRHVAQKLLPVAPENEVTADAPGDIGINRWIGIRLVTVRLIQHESGFFKSGPSRRSRPAVFAALALLEMDVPWRVTGLRVPPRTRRGMVNMSREC
jgi:hypothetical protein